jgi:glycerophosphoryl diester phosphodiesterase
MMRNLILAFAVLGMTTLPVPAFEFFQPVQPPRRCQVMVHRGQMHQAPENTAPAIEHAIRDLLEWVEVDVRLSKEGVHVLVHDSTVDRITDGAGQVADLTVKQLKQLDAGSKFAPRFAGTRILTLAECLALSKQRINLYLDCKQIAPQQLVAEIEAAGMTDQVVVFDSISTLQQIRELSQGRIAVMPKWHPAAGEQAPWLDELRPAIVEIDAPQITPGICATFHNRGIRVQAKVLGPWDHSAVWERMLTAGVDYVQTDLPEEFLAFDLERRIPDRPVQFALHRGASRYAPENTQPAIEKAVRLGADYVEIDVRTAADQALFVLHDATVDARTNGHGPITQFTADALRQLDAGSWFSSEFKGLRLIELDPALALLAGKSGCYFDAKALSPQHLVQSLHRHHMVETTVIFQGPGFLQQVRQLEPRARLMPPLYRAEDLDRTIERFKPFALDVRWEILSPELIARAHQSGVQIFSDAIGEHDHWQQHLEKIGWGIDVIQTDHPLHVLRAIELHAARK